MYLLKKKSKHKWTCAVQTCEIKDQLYLAAVSITNHHISSLQVGPGDSGRWAETAQQLFLSAQAALLGVYAYTSLALEASGVQPLSWDSDSLHLWFPNLGNSQHVSLWLSLLIPLEPPGKLLKRTLSPCLHPCSDSDDLGWIPGMDL